MLIWSKPTTYYISVIYMHISKDLIYHTDHVTVSLLVFKTLSGMHVAKEIKL